MLDAYERFILILGFYFGEMWKFLEKRPFFRADLAGLGKYRTGGFGLIGVYRVNLPYQYKNPTPLDTPA